MEANILGKRGCCPCDPRGLCKHLPSLKCMLSQVSDWGLLADGSTHIHSMSLYVNWVMTTWWATGAGVGVWWENWTATPCSCVVIKWCLDISRCLNQHPCFWVLSCWRHFAILASFTATLQTLPWERSMSRCLAWKFPLSKEACPTFP